jgi:hypothetical protein
MKRHDLSSSLNIMVIRPRRRRWVGHMACVVMKGNADRVFVEKPERNRPLG